MDGHIVKSKGELIIDNYLFLNEIRHTYEKELKMGGQKVKSDWYLPEYDIYIEYWGYYGKNYINRKKEKLRLYRNARLKLISIENFMFNDIYHYLNKLVKKKEQYLEKKVLDDKDKYCFNCGISLDERF